MAETARTNAAAESAYKQALQDIAYAMADLSISLAAHAERAQQGGIHWGHVGDVQDILRLLHRAMNGEA